MICDRIRVLLAGARGATVPIAAPTPSPSPTPTPTPAAFQTGAFMGANGEKLFLIGPWLQNDGGYSVETGTYGGLFAIWKGRGCNTLFLDHPARFFGTAAAGDDRLAAAKAAGMMIVAKPVPTTGVGNDYSLLSVTDSYWKDHWLYWPISDEPEQDTTRSVDDWKAYLESCKTTAGGIRKPSWCSLVSGGIYRQEVGTEPRTYYEYISAFDSLGGDAYPWHFLRDERFPQPNFYQDGRYRNTFHFGGPYPNGSTTIEQCAIGHEFTATPVGMAADILKNGPFISAIAPDGFSRINSLPAPYTNKPIGQYIATGRVDLAGFAGGSGFDGGGFQNGGRWQPARFLRLYAWDAIIHGVSQLPIFPQCASSLPITGSISGSTLTVSAITLSGENNARIFAPMDIISDVGGYTNHGRITAQLTGAAGDVGTFTISNPVAVASRSLSLFPPESTDGDGTNPANKAELVNLIANINLLQAHPTGGNLLMDPVNGGRKPFTIYRCPDTTTDPSVATARANMTTLTARTYVEGHSKWVNGWPMGFQGFEVTGDDGKKYRVVQAMSETATASFTYSSWGVSGMSFGPCEVKLFTDASQTNQLSKAGIDD